MVNNELGNFDMENQVPTPRVKYSLVPSGNESMDKIFMYYFDGQIQKSVEPYVDEIPFSERHAIDPWISRALKSIRIEFIDMGCNPDDLNVLLPEQFHLFTSEVFNRHAIDDVNSEDDSGYASTLLSKAKILLIPGKSGNQRTKLTIIHEAIHLMAKPRYKLKLKEGFVPSEGLQRLAEMVDEIKSGTKSHEQFLEMLETNDIQEELDGALADARSQDGFVLKDKSRTGESGDGLFDSLNETFVQYMALRVMKKNALSLNVKSVINSYEKELFSNDSNISFYRPAIFDFVLDGIANFTNKSKDEVLSEYAQAYLESKVPRSMLREVRGAFGKDTLRVIASLKSRLIPSEPNLFDRIVKATLKAPKLLLKARKFALRRGWSNLDTDIKTNLFTNIYMRKMRQRKKKFTKCYFLKK